MSGIILPRGVEVPFSSGWTRVGDDLAGERFIHRGKMLTAIRSQDMGRWHLSVSHVDRVPTWGELGFARDHLLPADAWMMIAHPPRKYWLNYDRRVLHLWEFRDQELIEQFRWEGEQAQAMGCGTPDDGGAR
jgi:hypothetical protein